MKGGQVGQAKDKQQDSVKIGQNQKKKQPDVTTEGNLP